MGIIYKGWIPTVGGKLSFSVAGCYSPKNNHHKAPIVTPVTFKGDRYIFGSQIRDLSDVPPLLLIGKLNIFRRIVNKLHGTDGNFQFLLFSKNSDMARPGCINSSLEGHLYVFRARDVDSQEVEKARVRAKKYNGDSDSYSFVSECTGEEILNKCIAHYRIDLSRSGECTLESISTPMQESKVQHVASEAFFFLKDFFHAHQHHNPRTDTIVDLYEHDGVDGVDWINETLRGLYRKVLDFKRMGDNDSYSSALGVIQYVKTFKRGVASSVQEKIDLCDDNLEESIRIGLSGFEYQLSENRSKHSRALAYTAFLLTFVLAYFRVIAHKIPYDESEKWPVDSTSIKVINVLGENFWLWIVMIVILYWLVYSIPGKFKRKSNIKAWTVLFVSLGRRSRLVAPIAFSFIFGLIFLLAISKLATGDWVYFINYLRFVFYDLSLFISLI